MATIQRLFSIREWCNRGRPTREDGFAAMAMVLLMTMILSITSGTLFLTSLSQQSNSAGQVFQSLALNAAEAGLSRAYQAVEQTSLASVPCGSNVLGEPLGTSPRSSTYSDSINYYSTNPPSGTPLSCSAVTSGTSIPASALVTSVGTDANVQQGMEALVAVSVASGGNVFDQALFVNSNVSAFGATIDGSVGNNADVYINGNLTNCSGTTGIHGNIVVQGSVSGFTGTCDIYGNLTAKSSVNLGGTTIVNGNDTSTTSEIYLNGTASVYGNAYAYTNITVTGAASVKGTKVANDTTLTGPPVETFPTFNFNAADWTSAGWTVEAPNNTCTSTGIYAEINALATAVSPTVLQTSCDLSFSGTTTIKTAQNTAIITTGGFSMGGTATWQSADGNAHNVYIMVPSSVSPSCSTGEISFAGTASFDTPLKELYFTPCTFSGGGTSEGYGQIYAGTFTESGTFSYTLYQPPTPPDATGGGSTPGGGAVTDGVVWEHQYQT